MPTSQFQKSRWGSARFGGGPGALIGVAGLCGLVLALGLGALFGLLAVPGNRLLGSVLFAVMILPVAFGLFWALFVDRATLAGALQDPETTVENHWYDRAAGAAFTDLLLALGVGAAIFSFTPFEANIGLVLAGVLLLGMIDFAVRYQSLKRAEG